VTASYPAPAETGALLRYVQRTAVVARVIAILLVTLVSLRLAVASVQRALTVSKGNFAEKPVRHADATPRPSASAAGAAPARSSAVSRVPAVAPGQSRRVTLGVSAGPPRSDVYVNGRKVGQTPFLGDTSCKTGQAIRIEIVPAKGAPLVYSRDCLGGALDISDPPL
jgi:hypothetical protein